MARARNVFGGKASNIVRVVLVECPKTASLRTIAKKAGVALGWASKISKELIAERYAIRDSKRSELKLMNPLALLKRWASFNNFTANTKFLEYYSSEEDILKFISSFKGKRGPEYAFTVLAGALLVAPFVRPSNIHVYVKSEEDARKWAKLLGLSPVEENGNVKFAIPGNAGVFYGATQVNGVNVVSDVQLYVDLLNYPARGEDAAGVIYKKIEKRWLAAKR